MLLEKYLNFSFLKYAWCDTVWLGIVYQYIIDYSIEFYLIKIVHLKILLRQKKKKDKGATDWWKAICLSVDLGELITVTSSTPETTGLLEILAI